MKVVRLKAMKIISFFAHGDVNLQLESHQSLTSILVTLPVACVEEK